MHADQVSQKGAGKSYCVIDTRHWTLTTGAACLGLPPWMREKGGFPGRAAGCEQDEHLISKKFPLRLRLRGRWRRRVPVLALPVASIAVTPGPKWALAPTLSHRREVERDRGGIPDPAAIRPG